MNYLLWILLIIGLYYVIKSIAMFREGYGEPVYQRGHRRRHASGLGIKPATNWQKGPSPFE